MALCMAVMRPSAGKLRSGRSGSTSSASLSLVSYAACWKAMRSASKSEEICSSSCASSPGSRVWAVGTQRQSHSSQKHSICSTACHPD